MGGFGSGGRRWGAHRATVESCYRFDAKQIAGLFKTQPGQMARLGFSWNDGTAALFEYIPAGAPMLTLTLVRESERAEHSIRLSTTPCLYGGVRWWLHCPWCERRVFRLYLYPRYYFSGTNERVNRFACRWCMCGGLSYYLRNEKDPYHVLMTRCGRIKKKLGGKSDYMTPLPYKPRGMRWRTYERCARQFAEAHARANEAFIEDTWRKFPQLFADVFGGKRGKK